MGPCLAEKTMQAKLQGPGEHHKSDQIVTGAIQLCRVSLRRLPALGG
jgi:hypothetical protein